MKKHHRFLIDSLPTTETFEVTDPVVVHLIKTVLRISPGEECRFFSAKTDDVVATILTIEKNSILCKKVSISPKVLLPRSVTALVSITKRDTFEIVVQKLTELGVSTIVPLLSDRTVKQSLRLDRLQKISDEALEQSGHSQRVTITEPQQLTSVIAQYSPTESTYFDIDATAPLSSLSKTIATFYIGPEGGWSEKEKELFKENNIAATTLGGTVLRAETAAIVAAYTLIWQ